MVFLLTVLKFYMWVKFAGAPLGRHFEPTSKALRFREMNLKFHEINGCPNTPSPGYFNVLDFWHGGEVKQQSKCRINYAGNSQIVWYIIMYFKILSSPNVYFTVANNKLQRCSKITTRSMYFNKILTQPHYQYVPGNAEQWVPLSDKNWLHLNAQELVSETDAKWVPICVDIK